MGGLEFETHIKIGLINAISYDRSSPFTTLVGVFYLNFDSIQVE
jgi:hypothetical protein